MRDSLSALRTADPLGDVDFQAADLKRAFDDIFDAIVDGAISADDGQFVAGTPAFHAETDNSKTRRSKHRVLALSAIAAAVALVAASLILGLGHGGPSPSSSLPVGSHVTAWHAARPLPVTLQPPASRAAASWELVSLVVNAGWQVNTSGPPPGQLTCPTVTTCFALAVRYASPKGGAQPESVSLYVSSDFGTTWSVLPMPAGFIPKSELSCPSEQVCAVGGTEGKEPTFAVTIDGGHQWGVVAVSGTDVLKALACRSAAVCVGVLQSAALRSPNDDTSIVRTADGGASWALTSVPVAGTVVSLACPSDQACVALGYSGVFRSTNVTGFVLTSKNGGQNWALGSLPPNFGFASFNSEVSCGDADNCMAIGITSIPNPERCEGTPPHVTPPPGFDSCSSSSTFVISAVAVTSNGGTTWESRSLPVDVPLPQLGSLSCASAMVCWVAGQEAVAQVIGNVHDAGSPVMVGTSNGGATWSKATFAIPPDAPNYLGQSYLNVGDISCPDTSGCLALGSAAQSAPSTPIYRYGG